MIGQFWAIVRNTFLESIRQPIYLVLILGQGLLTVLTVAMAAFSMSDDNKLFLDMAMGSIFGAGVILSAFLATSILTKEIDNKTVLTVVSKPIGRPIFVLGKYLGVSAAILMAVVIMCGFFLLASRHGVMSTARDKLDQPVLLFTFIAVIGSLGLGAWGNYFYGWIFTSTACLTLFPTTLLAWAGTLVIGKTWELQTPTSDLNVQIFFGLTSIILAILVFTAIAIAASTRLGQVMTLMVCLGAFLIGLLGNYMLGRFAIDNTTLAVVKEVRVIEDSDEDFSDDGDEYFINTEPTLSLLPGDSLYYGPRPGGLGMITPQHTESQRVDVTERVAPRRFTFEEYNQYMNLETGELENLPEELANQLPEGTKFMNVGGLPHARPVQVGDRIFERPTTYNYAALAAWTLLPNLQSFWMVDALTQELPIPASHMGMVALYALLLITALLSLAVALFQTREVG